MKPFTPVIVSSFGCLLAASIQSAEVITSLAPGFEMNVFAEQPEISTPVGIAIDGKDRIYVVESHTHQTPSDYKGPNGDLIKIFKDDDGDGKSDSVSVFASGFRASMNLAFAKGQLYLVQRDQVVLLPDNDGNGKADETKTLLHLETEEDYPHNGLDGLAFSEDGWMYIGMGENLGRSYTLKGSDGSTIQGGGEGGNIFRCRPDGSKLGRYATGFWNPFSITFDQSGRMYCVDNDPDGRPPSRLLHVVQGGDYGYKFRYGRSGLHPFVAWEGEIPGTLGMLAGTGEAPSGILVCREAGWPESFANSLLVTAWGDNTLELYDLRPEGATFTAEKQIFVQGDSSFRPVAFATNSKKDTFITDWSDKSYPVHGKGRIWRLRSLANAKVSGKTSLPNQDIKNMPVWTSQPTEGETRANRLRGIQSRDQYQELLTRLKDKDPFIKAAAIHALLNPLFRELLNKDAAHPDNGIRLGVAVVLRRIDDPAARKQLPIYLADPAEEVRRVALIWAAESGSNDLLPHLEKAVGQGRVSGPLFATYIAAAEMLNPAEPKENRSIWSGGDTASGLIEKTLRNPAAPNRLKAVALSMLPATNSLPVEQLKQFLRSNDSDLQAETIFFLAANPMGEKQKLLQEAAEEIGLDSNLRAAAVAGLAPVSSDIELLKHLKAKEPSIQIEALRALRLNHAPQELKRLAEPLLSVNPPDGVLEQWEHLTGTEPKTYSDQEWLQRLGSDGDPAAGRRRYFDPTVGCATCHQVNGRGGNVGPDLSLIARSLDRERIIDSILNPSANIAPEFVTYEFEVGDDSFSGVVRSRGNGQLTIGLPNGDLQTVENLKIAARREMKASLMPDDLEKSLAPDDFRNLLAFLLSLK
ncbi:MAG: PVC-type heme-binding CxxCH protein [Verrucomicrobiales bacterium]